MAMTLKVNGRDVEVSAEPDTPLLWVLRDELKLKGTKFGCGVASCGACTVHVDGVETRSCSVTIGDLDDGTQITTIEGVLDKPEGIPGKAAVAVTQAWEELDVVQCGYCQSGQVMQAVVLLVWNPKPTDEEIDEFMSGNVCRCNTYHRIRAGIHLAASKLEG